MVRLLCALTLAVVSSSVHPFDLRRGLGGAGGALEDVGRMWQQQQLIEDREKALIEQQHRQRMEQMEREHQMRLELQRQQELRAEQEARRRQQDLAKLEEARRWREAESERAQAAAERAQREAEAAKVDRAHPGWVELVRTEEFGKWFDKQPTSVRSLGASERAEDSILVLDLYKRDTTAAPTKKAMAPRKRSKADAR